MYNIYIYIYIYIYINFILFYTLEYLLTKIEYEYFLNFNNITQLLLRHIILKEFFNTFFFVFICILYSGV